MTPIKKIPSTETRIRTASPVPDNCSSDIRLIRLQIEHEDYARITTSKPDPADDTGSVESVTTLGEDVMIKIFIIPGDVVKIVKTLSLAM